MSFNGRISFPRAAIIVFAVFVLLLLVFAASGPLTTWGEVYE